MGHSIEWTQKLSIYSPKRLTTTTFLGYNWSCLSEPSLAMIASHMSQYTPTQYVILFSLLIAEGGVVLAHQIIAPKIAEPIFGNSILVWSAVLVCALAGLSIGYALGDLISQKSTIRRLLAGTMIAAAMALYSTPFLGTIALFLSDRLPLIPGIAIGTALIVAPLMIMLGTCCPLAVAILHQDGWQSASATGAVFATSTIGGIIAATVVAVWALPSIGIQLTCFVAATLLLCASVLFGVFCTNSPAPTDTTGPDRDPADRCIAH